MAKKKAISEDVPEVPKKQKDKAEFISASNFLKKPRHVISVSPAIDLALNGGVPEGSWLIINGAEKVGKTTTLLHFAANCQKPENGSREVYYFDVEGRIRERNLKGVPHLNIDKLHILRSTEKRKLTANDFLEQAYEKIKDIPKCVVIMDSFSSLITDDEIAKGLGGNKQTTLAAKLCSEFVRLTSQDVSANNCIVIGVTQFMANPGGFGSSKSEKVATAIKYQGDIKLEAVKKTEFGKSTGKKDAFGKDIIIPTGQRVTWLVKYCALGPPGRKAESIITYGIGVDEVAELIDMGSDINIINQGGGGNYTFNIDGQEVKKKGKENMVAYLKENPKAVESLKRQIKEVLSDD
jgi:recombination protein RecA